MKDENQKQQALKALNRLIRKFESEQQAGRLNDYNEEATKTAFIQPLLKDVLGWNVEDRNEVSPEEKVSRNRVDYGLKVDGKVRIFVEAKPVRADLNRHIEQAVWYGYNRKDVPFVLLTDFEGLKLFDVTVKPNSRNPLKGLKIDLKWNQYEDQFDKLWLISKPAVLSGELDKLLLVKPKDRIPVDKAILNDLRNWREALAKDLFRNNSDLFHSGDTEKDATYLKEITQRLLDRVLFMRSCEDRGLIHRPPLKRLFEERTEVVGTRTMVFLREEFKHYNIIFDSDMFSPKEWEEGLQVDFKTVKEIVLETYDPYQFDVIPLEVLGNIYEQYLGYTIRLTEKQVKYELKPDVRKAGGVYYTPEYIVDYIVKNTVGRLLKEMTPVKIRKLRILDPACGSGSFLIRAYEEMMRYYLDLKKTGKKTLAYSDQVSLDLKHDETGPRLSIHEKSAILKNHIFGVDIDEQAVEVTKLSLMLKMLDGEYGIVYGRAILPMLDRNIRCGNSLVSGSTLELKKYFGDEWYKVKPFNWEDEFREIMVKEGGFDVVVGNPPYGAYFSNDEKKYFLNKFITFKGNNNSYTLFLTISVVFLKEKGIFGLITPTTFLTGDNFFKLRELLLLGNVFQLIKLPYNIFIDAYIDTSICLYLKDKLENKIEVANIPPKTRLKSSDDIHELLKKQDKRFWLKDKNICFLIESGGLIIKNKILQNPHVKLEEICQVDRGTLPPKTYTSSKIENIKIFKWFDGQIYRYVFQKGLSKVIDCNDLSEFKTANMFV
jgi:hypothetical protein